MCVRLGGGDGTGSTLGGFLIGFGLFLFLGSLGASMALSWALEWKDEIEMVYRLTRSPDYEKAIKALDALSPYANRLADLVRDYGQFLGIQQIEGDLRAIPAAASQVKELSKLSNMVEPAYYAMTYAETASRYVVYGSIVALAILLIGVVLAIRARGKRAS